MKRFLIILVLGGELLLSSVFALEQPALPDELNLEEARRLALQYNPTLRRFRESLAEQDGVILERKALRKPKLSLNGNYTGTDDARQQTFGDFAFENTSWGADAESEITIYSGGRNREEIESAKDTRRAIKQDVQSIQQDVLAGVQITYLDALLARETVKVRNEGITVLEAQLGMASNRFVSGAGARFEVLQAEVAVANAKPPLIRAENDYLRSVDSLRRQIGLPFPEGVEAGDLALEGSLEPLKAKMELATSLASALASRPEMKGVGHEIDAARKRVSAAKKERSPKVDLFAGYGVESDQFGAEDSLQGWKAGVRLAWPIFEGGRIKGKVQQQESALDQAVQRRREVALMVEGEVRTAFYDYEEAQSIIDTTSLVIEQAEEALRLASNRYNAGRGTQLDVLESQLQLTRSKLEYSTALRNLQKALVDLQKAVGMKL